MKSYFESSQDSLNRVTVTLGPDFSFPAHFHRKTEVFILKSGSYNVYRNGKSVALNAGDVIVFDSYDIHSYDKKRGEVEGLAIMIPPSAAENFFNRKGSKKITDFVVSDKRLCEKIYELGKDFIAEKSIPDTVRNGAAELILALLEPHLGLKDTDCNDETTLAQNLLFFINRNYKNEIGLKILAKEFGYTAEHISRVFNRYLNASLPEYVNALRLDYIENALKNGTSEKITSLLFSAGFKSIQAYYRAKNKRNAVE